jgi:hypothetical protein
MKEKRGFALYGKQFAFSKVQSKDEKKLDLKLKQDIETRKIKTERKQQEKSEKIRLAKLKMQQRKKLKSK